MNRYNNATTRRTLPMKVARVVIAACSLASPLAFAALGGNIASVTADKAAMQAGISTSAKAGYTDYALTLPSGVVVHEFVNDTNQVFEVTWYGKGMRPDMKQLLGGYFARFQPGAKGPRPTVRRLDRVDTDFELHSAGHNRLFSGTAHLPANLPASLSGPLAVPEIAAAPVTSGAASR